MRTRIVTAPMTSLVLGLSMIAPSLNFGSEPLAVMSPDGKIKVEVELKANPQPYLPGERAYYRVSYKGAQLLKDSPLGLDSVGRGPWIAISRFLGRIDSLTTAPGKMPSE